ncbi:hypothetical protein BMS3Abin04_01381 [bacterium BMS3Abin04]|nr:hypothetical protein BMS3Abin04_01381 [bacterium BMS3Abin04]
MLQIKVVGTGCPNCLKLKSLVEEVIKVQNVPTQIESITDYNELANLGIFITPGLIVNNKILSSSKISTKSTLEHWLSKIN